MKLVSWNVNGLRSALKKGFGDFVRKEKPDILCLQETKSSHADIPVDLPQYRAFWNHAERKGYAGTATFCGANPISVKFGLGIREHDREGRVTITEHPDFHVVNVYVPNSKRDLSRLDYRAREWDPDLLQVLGALEESKPVVVCGDMNVAHEEIDLAYPDRNHETHGFTDKERAGFRSILDSGFVDTFRALHPGQPGHFTWWAQWRQCRERNIGWRIDYVLVSKSLVPRVKKAFIVKDVMGSDHCPVGIVLE